MNYILWYSSNFVYVNFSDKSFVSFGPALTTSMIEYRKITNGGTIERSIECCRTRKERNGIIYLRQKEE